MPVVGIGEASGAGSLRRGGLAVAVASNAANVLGLALYLALIRLLDRAEYGAVGALLALLVVGSVPGMALQLVLARRTATTPPQERAATWAALLARGAAVGVAVSALAAVLAPVATGALHLDSVAPTLWLAASLAPTTVLYAVAGLLQGAERFAGLAACLVLAAAGRLAGALAGSAGGVTGVLAGSAVGAGAACALAVPLVLREVRGHRPGGTPDRLFAELRAATSGMSGLLAVQNVDVVLARHLLPEEQSGVYAAGALVARGAFWMLHVVAVVVLPRLADPALRRSLLPRAVALVAGAGAVFVLAALLTGPSVLPWAFGADYRSLGATVGVFALVGGLVALAELALYADLAVRRHRVAWGLWATLAVFVALVYAVGARGVTSIAWLDVLPLAVLAAAGTAATLRTAGRAGRAPDRPGVARPEPSA